MEWINCNSCFSQPCENANIQFSLTSCGHIFCEKCDSFVAGTLDCCKMCKTKCSSVIIGDKRFQTNPQVLEYFQDPEKECETMVQVIKFQKAHRIKLFEHHKSITSKYNKAKLYIKKLENELMVTKNALQNIQRKYRKPYSVVTENQSMMSTPSFLSNSISFAKSKSQHAQSMKHKMPDMRHREQSIQNGLASKESIESEVHVPGSGSSVYSSALQNVPQQFQNPYSVAAENQSVISTPSFLSNSNSFKKMNVESRFQHTPSVEHKMQYMRHRKQSFQSELSLSSAESNVSGIHASGSSVYSSPYQQNYDEHYMPAMDDLYLNSFGNRQFRKE